MKWLSRCLALWFLLCPALRAADTFRIATFNLENYLDRATESRPNPKSSEAKAKVRDSILAAKPDVLALQEIGEVSALLELRESLKAAGLHYAHWEHVRGFDTNIYVAVLSRFPITARRPHTNETFLLHGRRFRSSRGFAEVDVKVNDRYSFTLITAHLKSKRPSGFGDESEIRNEEAKLLRKIVDANLSRNANANLVLLGDFNDTRNSASLRTLIGRGRTKLLDTRPSENSGPQRSDDRRRVTWTHFYATEDTYSRIDYVLLSPGMAREWKESESFVLATPDWGIASDHRPVVVTLDSAER